MKFTPNVVDIVGVVFLFALAILASGTHGVSIGREDMQEQAVERGCGRYVVTAEREVKFEWVECAKEAQGK